MQKKNSLILGGDLKMYEEGEETDVCRMVMGLFYYMQP